MKTHWLLFTFFLLGPISAEAKKKVETPVIKKEVRIPKICGQITNESSVPTTDLTLVVHYFSFDDKKELKTEKAVIDESGKYCIPDQTFQTERGISTSLDLLNRGEVLSLEGFRSKLSPDSAQRLLPLSVTIYYHYRDVALMGRAYSHLILKELKENQQVLKIKTLYDKSFADLARAEQKIIYPDVAEPLPWAIEISNIITVPETYGSKSKFTFKTILDQANPSERCGELFPNSNIPPQDITNACIASSATDYKDAISYNGRFFPKRGGKTLFLSTDLTEDLLKTTIRDTTASIVFFRNGKIDQRIPMKLYLFDSFPENCQYLYSENREGQLISGVQCLGTFSELLGIQNYVLGVQ